jgi:hypothetical protein
MNLQWLKLDVLFPIQSGLDNEEISEIDTIRLKSEGIEDGFEVGTAYCNVGNDPIVQINPRCFIPKGKQNRKYYSEIVFQSGTIIYGLGKPDVIYQKLSDYVDQFDIPEDKGTSV